MSLVEETIDATLDSNGQLQLSHASRVVPGPVKVTIRCAVQARPRRGIAEVLREIMAEQRARGYPGWSADEIQAWQDERMSESEERDRELDAARGILPADQS